MVCHWKIRIAGYGTIDFEGTEEEAEEQRRAKARWERAIGTKWRVTNQTEIDKLIELRVWYWDRKEGAPSFIDRRIRQIRKAERTQSEIMQKLNEVEK